MFHTFIGQPIINILGALYALIPGHNLGLTIIVFTVLVRLAMWPIIRKQLVTAHHLRAIQPELKRIKKETKGDPASLNRLTMELYRERGINPAAPIITLIIQLPIFIGLYSAITKITNDPQVLVNDGYGFVRNLPALKELANGGSIDASFFGLFDLRTVAVTSGKPIFWPAMAIALLSAVLQFVQIKMTMPKKEDAKSLRQIFKDASDGKQADSSELAAATSQTTSLFLTVFIFYISTRIPGAAALYITTGSAIQILQQRYITAHLSELDGTTVSGKSSGVSVKINGKEIEGELSENKNKDKDSKTTSNKKRDKRRR